MLDPDEPPFADLADECPSVTKTAAEIRSMTSSFAVAAQLLENISFPRSVSRHGQNKIKEFSA